MYECPQNLLGIAIEIKEIVKYFGEIVIFNFVSERNVMPLRLEDVATKISREISWKKGRVE